MTLLDELRDLTEGSVDFYHWLHDEITNWAIGEEAWMRGGQPALTCEAGRDGPHEAVTKRGDPTGHLLCSRHYEDLDKTLMAIEREAENMSFSDQDPESWATLPTMAMALGGTHGGTLASQQTPARLDPIVLSDRRHGKGTEEDETDRRVARTDSLLDVLGRWAARTREGRDIKREIVRWADRLPGVMRCGPVCDFDCPHESCRILTWRVCNAPCDHDLCGSVAWWKNAPSLRTVHTERIVLSRQLEWIAGQPWVIEFDTKMRRLLAQLKQANGTSAQRPIPGKCPNLINGSECGGPLWPTKPKETSQSAKWTGTAPSAIQCGSCKTRWEGAGPLALLAIILDKQKKAKQA